MKYKIIETNRRVGLIDKQPTKIYQLVLDYISYGLERNPVLFQTKDLNFLRNNAQRFIREHKKGFTFGFDDHILSKLKL
jgi:hypothetical protein